jgi:hypothetical protein
MWYMSQKRTSMQARSSILGTLATMRAAQGAEEDKQEAEAQSTKRRFPLQVNIKVSTHPHTRYISTKRNFNVQLFFFILDGVDHNDDVVHDAKTNFNASEIINFRNNSNHARGSSRGG